MIRRPVTKSIRTRWSIELSHNVTFDSETRTAKPKRSQWAFAVLDALPSAECVIEVFISGGATASLVAMVGNEGTGYYTQGSLWKCGSAPAGFTGWSAKDFRAHNNEFFALHGDVALRMESGQLTVTCVRNSGEKSEIVLKGFPPTHRIAIGIWNCSVMIKSVTSVRWERRKQSLLLVLLLLKGRATSSSGVILATATRLLPWDVIEIIFEWI